MKTPIKVCSVEETFLLCKYILKKYLTVPPNKTIELRKRTRRNNGCAGKTESKREPTKGKDFS